MTIKEIMQPFDSPSKTGFDEHDVWAALKQLLPDDKSTIIDKDLRAEMMAWSNSGGTVTESLSIKLITPEMIEYWEKRAVESTNPIIVARYSGLVWNFGYKITGTNPSHETCRLYIDALIAQANENFHKYKFETFGKLKRALELCISLNDHTLIEKCKDAIISFENKYAQDTEQGLWGHAFDILVDNKKVSLTKKEEASIIEELEKRLSRLTTSDTEGQEVDPWAAEAAAVRLGRYYRKAQRNEDTRRVILKVGRAFDKIIGSASAMQASGWLDNLHNLYLQFNLMDEANELLLRIRGLGFKVASEMKLKSHSFSIPQKEMDKYISTMTEGDIQKVLHRIVIRYIPNKEQVKEQVIDLSKKAPLTFFLSKHQIQDGKGRVIATIGSLENDLQGHVVKQVSQNLSLSSVFLGATLQESIDRKGLNKIQILKFIENTPIIDEERFEIIDRGLDAYFSSDFLVTIHLLVPQIEEAIRNIVEFSGGNVLKPSRGGGYHLRTFDEILRDNVIKETLGEDFSDYLRVLFTDQRGWNIRNNVCHGLVPPSMFDQQTADRVIHTLLCLGSIKEKEE
ncbi:MAG: DUF4209 domain-containing protein [Pseudohongiellaceae bacterium]